MDLRAAHVDLAAKPPLIEDALFHCQQAVEKALKAFLTLHAKPFGKTHDLDLLAQSCEAILPSLARGLKAVRPLTVFAWKFRYPGESKRPSLAAAKKFEAVAIMAVGHVTSMMSGRKRA